MIEGEVQHYLQRGIYEIMKVRTNETAIHTDTVSCWGLDCCCIINFESFWNKCDMMVSETGSETGCWGCLDKFGK